MALYNFFFQSFTTTTALNTKETKLAPKLVTKWAHPSGFTVEKFEISEDCKFSIETSLTGAAPGLKLEFKGNDKDKSDLSFTYNAPAATISGEFDLLSLNSAKASVCGGLGPLVAGANGEFKGGDYTIGLGASYSIPKLFLGVRADKNFASYNATFNYAAVKDISLAGKVSFETKDKKVGAVLAAIYKCNPSTVIKAKANSADGNIAFSVKQLFPGKMAVVGSAEVPSKLDTAKFGLNATLG